jgi:hypothetical protein
MITVAPYKKRMLALISDQTFPLYVVVKKRSGIQTFFSTTTYAPIP